jgi:uncharacterized protein YlzI (FlbEa/FlbD family)
MDKFPKDLSFLKDQNLDGEYKKIILQKLLEERSQKRDHTLKTEENRATKDLENKKFWHNTPLVVTLVGTISIFANGAVAYFQSMRNTSNTITLKQVEAELAASEKRIEAKHQDSKEEREFAFKIIEQQLATSTDAASRAEVLLFLVRAGILNSLDRVELEKMALVEYRKAGKDPNDAGIPSSLGFGGIVFTDIDEIDMRQISTISTSETAGSFTEIHVDGLAGALYVRESQDELVEKRRRSYSAALIRLHTPVGRPVWIDPRRVFRVSGTASIREANSRIDLAYGGFQAVKEGMQELQSIVEVAVNDPGTKLTAPNGSPVLINPDYIIYLKEATASLDVHSELILGPGSWQAVKEDVQHIMSKLNATQQLAKLTALDGSALWVNPHAVIRVQEEPSRPGSSELTLQSHVVQQIREDGSAVQSALKLNPQLQRLHGSDGSQVWINLESLVRVQEVLGYSRRTELTLTDGILQTVYENAAAVQSGLTRPLKKLTAANGSPVWLEEYAIARIRRSNSVSGAQTELTTTDGTVQLVQEDVRTARQIIGFRDASLPHTAEDRR